jgi:hypothetical protein
MAIYQRALEPNMPPRSFFGSLGSHGTSPRSFLNFADDTKVPGGVPPVPFSYRTRFTKSGGHRGETAAPISAASAGVWGMGADGLNLFNSGPRFAFLRSESEARALLWAQMSLHLG